MGHDAGEFQFVPYIFGIPHITGYPLFLLIGKAWTFLPLGSVAWRMNLLSALFGALAAGVACAAGWQLTGSAAGGTLAGLATGLASLEWTWSTIAGVRSLAVAFVAAALLAALRWEEAVRDGDPKLAERRFVLLALVCGLALDNHRTFALLLPFLGLYVLMVRWRTLGQTRVLEKAAVAFLVPLLLYGVLPLRAAMGAPWDQLNTATWRGFVNLTIAGSDAGAHFNLTPGQALARLPALIAALSGTFTFVVLAVAAIGLVWLAARRRPMTIVLAGYVLVLGWLTLEWHLGDELNLVYFLPAYPALALLAAAGLAAMTGLEWGVGSRESGVRGRLGRVRLGAQLVLVAAVAGGGLYLGRARFEPPRETLDDFRADLFQGHQARRLADALALLPGNATVVGDWDQASALWYAEFVDGINPSAAISYPASTLPDALGRAPGPVYLATATFRPPTTTVSAAGPYVEVLREPRGTLPPGVTQLGGSFGDEMQLSAMAPIGQPEYGVLPVTLYWTALKQPSADDHVSVRLMPSPDRVAAQRDEASPVLGLSPTSTWKPGQVTADYYELDLRGLPDGAYDLAVV
ncbi:MAG TPA: DUF2723 domain-containing protein, partial [Chloroflexota bacterium]